MTSQLFKKHRVLWMPLDVAWPADQDGHAHCCADMTSALAFECEQHADPFECGDSAIIYNPVFDEYGLVIHDGGASYVVISHCPWCAAQLPDSQRDQWFDETDAIDLGPNDETPEKYRTSAWRKKS